MNDKNKHAQEEAFDDVDRLFARLGSKGADEYRDFVPGRLPAREAAVVSEPVVVADVQAIPAGVVIEPPALPVPPPSPPILASIRPLRAEPVPPASVERPAGAPVNALDQLFQRLLQADAAPAAAGPLRRMFGR
jgi:hypothetical protein